MLRKILYIIIIFLNFSCSDNESVDNMLNKSETTLLSFTPVINTTMEPLSRNGDLNGVFAINILWKNFSSSYEPYASGLFDDINRAKIQLINGHLYRITCTFIRQDEIPYYNSEKGYGTPFNLKDVEYSPVNNTLLVDPSPFSYNKQFYSGIYSGNTRTSESLIESHPAIHRFYGVEPLNLVSKNDDSPLNINISLQRAYYTLQFKHDGLEEGDSIKISLSDDASFAPFVFKGEGKNIEQSSLSRLMTMKTITNFPNGGDNFGIINENEEVTLDIKYKKRGHHWIDLYDSNPHIILKRNYNNIIKLIDVDYKAENRFNMMIEEDELSNNNNITI